MRGGLNLEHGAGQFGRLCLDRRVYAHRREHAADDAAGKPKELCSHGVSCMVKKNFFFFFSFFLLFSVVLILAGMLVDS